MTPYRYCVVTCVKNEGPYLLEWLAHYRGLGVQEFLVFSNASTDGTTALLDHLDDRGLIRHLPNPSMAFEPPPHRAALLYAPHHRVFREADYVLILDVDEFLQVDLATPTLDALMAHFDAPDVLSVAEVLYGFGGVLEFCDTPVVAQFELSVGLRPGKWRARRGIKSIQRVAPHIADYSNHRPMLHEAAIDTVRWLDGRGERVPREAIVAGDRGISARGCYDVVRLNHYSLRSGEAMLAKFDRGDAVRNNRLTHKYFQKRDQFAHYNTDALTLLPRIQAEMERLLDDDKTRTLHEDTVRRYRAKIATLKTTLPEYWQAIQEQVACSSAALAAFQAKAAA